MLTLFFMGTTVICGLGWIFSEIAIKAIVKYMKDQGYKPPSDEEAKACSMYVLKKILHVEKWLS